MSVAPDIVEPNNTKWAIDKNELKDLVQNYVKRVEYEELPLLEKLGGSKGLAKILDSDTEKGLTVEQVVKELDSRQSAFGSNRLPKRPRTPFWVLLWEACGDFTLRILFVCGLVSIILGVTTGEHKSTDWIEGFAIWVAILVVVLVTASNDYTKEKQFEKLNAVKEDKLVSVIRSGAKQPVSVFDLLVGDLVFLEAGDEIPADCIVITSSELKIDESSLTGETSQVAKSNTETALTQIQSRAEKLIASTAHKHLVIDSPVILSGTTLTSGSCEAMVIAVGKYSQVGALYDMLQTDPEITPLQAKLENIARDIGRFGLYAAIGTLLALIIEFWIIYATQKDHSDSMYTAGHIVQTHVSFITIAITIVAVAVPEGLPLAVTISLAYSINKMLKDNNWVRKLQACETMGSANEICSDKTGTLTKNRMTVQSFWTPHKGLIEWNGMVPKSTDRFIEYDTFIEAEGGVDIEGKDTNDDLVVKENDKIINYILHKNIIDAFVQGIAINSTGYLDIEEKIIVNSGAVVEEIKHIGSPTECALLQFIRALGEDCEKLRAQYHNSVQHRVQFTSDRKLMTTVITHPSDPKLFRVFVKGAAERVLQLCTHRINKEGNIVAFTAGETNRIEKNVIQRLAGDALRTICIAYLDIDPEKVPNWKQELSDGYYQMEKNLVCLGITGIRDPVRDEVPAAVLSCHKAGINVRMVTGDNIETAKQIAIRCNIITKDRSLAMLGKDFYQYVGGVICANCRTEVCNCPRDSKQLEAMEKEKKYDKVKLQVREDVLGNPIKFREIKDRLAVLARSQPSDKYALVTGLKNEGAIVAVTGDGTNDAPALKKADVGFAMGIAGKEVAKQAADIVLLDDNFNSIIKAILWGRNIYDNIQRFLQFQLTVNIVAVFTAFMSALILRGSPLYAIQLLWVNLIMDSFASLALATEPPTDDLLNREPHSRDEYLITKIIWRNIIGHAIYQMIVLYTMIFLGERYIPEDGSLFNHFSKTLSQENIDKVIALLPLLPNPPAADTLYNATVSPYGDFVISGRDNVPFSSKQDYSLLIDILGPSRLYTMIFNTFVFMQAFNLINARKIHNEVNVFKGIFRNTNWICIFTLICGLQVILVQFGGRAFKVCTAGLSGVQWLICLGFGAFELLVHQLLRLIPVSPFPNTGKKEVNPLQNNPTVSQILRGRTTSSQFIRRAGSSVNQSRNGHVQQDNLYKKLNATLASKATYQENHSEDINTKKKVPLYKLFTSYFSVKNNNTNEYTALNGNNNNVINPTVPIDTVYYRSQTLPVAKNDIQLCVVQSNDLKSNLESSIAENDDLFLLMADEYENEKELLIKKNELKDLKNFDKIQSKNLKKLPKEIYNELTSKLLDK